MVWIQRFAFLLAIIFGAWTLCLSVLMGGLVPEPAEPLPRNYETPILLLEFAASEEDLLFLHGDEAGPVREGLQRVQGVDHWFPVAYAGMAFWCFLGLALRGIHLAWSGVIISAATIPADWAENAVINQILAGVQEAAAVGALLPDLAFATWTKWLLIAAFACIFGLVMVLNQRRILSIPAICAGVVIVLTAISRGSALFAELIMLPLALFFLTILLASVLYLRASFKAETTNNESPGKVES